MGQVVQSGSNGSSCTKWGSGSCGTKKVKLSPDYGYISFDLAADLQILFSDNENNIFFLLKLTVGPLVWLFLAATVAT